MNWNFHFFIPYLHIFFRSFLSERFVSVRIESIDSAVEPRKSAEASITLSKADRDSSSCDATRERITLSAWRRDSLLRDVRCKRPSRETATREWRVPRVCRLAAIAKSNLANFSLARVISSHESGNFPSRRPKRTFPRKRERDRRMFGGGDSGLCGMAADGQNGGAWKTRGWSFEASAANEKHQWLFAFSESTVQLFHVFSLSH